MNQNVALHYLDVTLRQLPRANVLFLFSAVVALLRSTREHGRQGGSVTGETLADILSVWHTRDGSWTWSC